MIIYQVTDYNTRWRETDGALYTFFGTKIAVFDAIAARVRDYGNDDENALEDYLALLNFDQVTLLLNKSLKQRTLNLLNQERFASSFTDIKPEMVVLIRARK